MALTESELGAWRSLFQELKIKPIPRANEECGDRQVKHRMKKRMPSGGTEMSGRTSLFLSAMLFCVAARSVSASTDLNVDVQSFWQVVGQNRDLHAHENTEARTNFVEIELKDDIGHKVLEPNFETQRLVSSSIQLKEISLQSPRISQQTSESGQIREISEAGQPRIAVPTIVIEERASPKQELLFPVGVPSREVLRVSETFQGMINEALRSAVVPYAARYLGSLTKRDLGLSTLFAEMENSWLDAGSDADEGYLIGEEIEEHQIDSSLDPSKTYTVVNGRIHSVTPQQSAPSGLAASPQGALTSASVLVSKSGELPPSLSSSQKSAESEMTLPQDEIKKGLSRIFQPGPAAAASGSGTQAERVSVQGKISLPVGFAKDRVVLRMAGTGFQFQTDSAGAFELRDVPRGTRFELLVWHLDGSLTRRLVPVTASGREKLLEIALEKTSHVDNLANAFGLVQKMNQAGFCGRVEAESTARLLGGTISVLSGRKEFQPHYFSSAGLPTASSKELSEDGRFCVFNVDEPLVDVKVTLINGIRRQFTLHLEPSVFEHDLTFDISESLYRRMSLLEPLDTQQILELSSQSVQPDFGDRRLRDWINGNDVPVWTVVSRFDLQSDKAYAAVRPKVDELQFFPGGQEFVELRVSPDFFGAPVSRVIVSRDQLFTQGMLRQIASLKSKIVQDKDEVFSVAALDADAWDDIAAKYVEVPKLQPQTTGGVFVSIDPSGLGQSKDDLVVTLRDTWTGKDVCSMIRLQSAKEIRSARHYRAVCGTTPGQYALIVESKEGVLLWSDVVRVRPGDVQTVTVFDPKF